MHDEQMDKVKQELFLKLSVAREAYLMAIARFNFMTTPDKLLRLSAVATEDIKHFDNEMLVKVADAIMEESRKNNTQPVGQVPMKETGVMVGG